MKLIYKVARTELRNLFYSPVAWFLFVAFMVQCAYFYSSALGLFAKWQTMIEENSPVFEGFNRSLTQAIFLNGGGIFNNAAQNLYLFLPVLTMGLISREMNNGTIKLLYSSPIKTRNIVFGKYLALMIFNLMLVAIISIFMVAGAFNIKHVDIGILLSALLGFYLLVCTYTAIGMFMSSLTGYQIVSAIATSILIFVLSTIGSLWQQYDFVREFTYFLSINGRVRSMLTGLITSRDIIYFIVITGMFISFTIFRLKGSREFSSGLKKSLRYLTVTAICLTIGYISSRHGLIGYWDTTRDKLHTIHPNTQQVIAGFDKNEPLEVTLYGNVLGKGFSPASPANRNEYIWFLWEKYIRFKPDIKFNYVYYYDVMDGDSSYFQSYPNKTLKQIAAMMADANDLSMSRFVGPEVVRKQIDLQPEDLRAVMQLKYKNRTAFLRTYDDTEFWPGEMNVAAALKRLLQEEAPKVLYTTGNYERSIYKSGEREYMRHSIAKDARFSLVNLGFDADTISPDLTEIPANISALVVADPKSKLSPLKEERIRQFMNNGGNTFLLGEPGKQEMLNPLLNNLGMSLGAGTLVQVTKDEMPQIVIPYVNREVAYMAEIYKTWRDKFKDPAYKDSLWELQDGAVEVVHHQHSPFKFTPMLQTIEGVYNKAGHLVVDSAAPIFSPAEGDVKKTPFTSMAHFTRKLPNKEQRIIVAGDADFMSLRRGSGKHLGTACFSWMDYNNFPVYVPPTEPLDEFLSISSHTADKQKIIFVWILPAILMIFGTILLIRRKRK